MFLAGTEVFSIWGLNSGVMYMNVPRMLADRGNLLDWGNEKKWQFMMYDQGMLETFYRQKVRAEELRRDKAPFRDVSEGNWHAWESFDELKFNARGFMRVPPEQPYLWHWHGFKPYDVVCWLSVLGVPVALRGWRTRSKDEEGKYCEAWGRAWSCTMFARDVPDLYVRTAARCRGRAGASCFVFSASRLPSWSRDGAAGGSGTTGRGICRCKICDAPFAGTAQAKNDARGLAEGRP